VTTISQRLTEQRNLEQQRLEIERERRALEQGRFFVIQPEATTTKAIFVFRDQKMKIALAVVVQRKTTATISFN